LGCFHISEKYSKAVVEELRVILVLHVMELEPVVHIILEIKSIAVAPSIKQGFTLAQFVLDGRMAF
jgi:hypothetical protein